jgi:hypothetical protein
MSKQENFEDKLFQAIVDQFFAPRPVGVDANGAQIWQESHVAGVARQFISQKRDDLYKAIIERLTVNEVAEKAAKLVLEQLEKSEGRYSYDPSQQIKADLTKAVRAKVADELAKRHLEAMDKEATQ